ncbi:MAG TPA: Flp family type IVb pilin [Gammaproteobacteria bacterium]|nr:Flp family type IVb pilin [Gammaproteobacteria bacterium]
MTTVKYRLLRNQKGASAVEYALVIALVALAIITALGTLETSITGFLGEVSASIDAQ